MMISHFINQILFSFLEQRRAIPLIPLPHLAAAYTFIPRGIAAAGRGNRGTTSARMGTSPDSSRPDSPRDFAPTEPVSLLQCFRSHAVLFGNGEIIA